MFRTAILALATAAGFLSATAWAYPGANAPATQSAASSRPLLLADNVRKVPKEKEHAKRQDPPRLPDSAIPGARNPRDNYDPPSGSSDTRKGGGVKDVKVPAAGGSDKCKGSPDCSKRFDGGR